MTEFELIGKQQLKLEDCKVVQKYNLGLKRDIMNKFYSIGAPLNDTILKFNKEQLYWCLQVIDLIKQLECE